MSQRVLAEAVSQYLESGLGHEAEYLSLLGSRRSELEPLLSVIRLLRQVLRPVEPSQAFAAALKARLMTMPVEDLPPATRAHPTKLVVGAVAFGSIVSAAAVYFLFTRARTARAA
jgi:hypothetical protein